MVDVTKIVAFVVRCFPQPLDHLFVPVDLLVYLFIALIAVSAVQEAGPRFVGIYCLLAQKMMIMQGAFVMVSLQIELFRRVFLKIKSMPR
jgi:hypothetical protein